VYSIVRFHPGCSCPTSASCFTLTSVFDRNGAATLFVVPGFYAGCYVIESLLHSTLECFHDQDCFDQVKYYVKSSLTTNATILNSSLSTRFTPNTIIQEIIDSLMVEQWKRNSSFEKYYNECNPIECTYTKEMRNDVLYIVTTMIGLCGGLVKILKLFVPNLVKLVRRRQVNSEAETGKLRLVTSMKIEQRIHFYEG
jgi:hypothetical protein